MFKCNTHCCQDRYSGGFGVVTFSGNLSGQHSTKGYQGNPVCNMPNPSNICHIVIVANYNSYPMDVDCTGTIPASTPTSRNLEFHSPNITDTDIWWHDTYTLIASIPTKIDEHPFRHVQLLPTTGQGPNDVDVDVIAKPSHRPPITIPKIRITVTV